MILQNSLLKEEKRKKYVEHAYTNVINVDTEDDLDEEDASYPRGDLTNHSSPTDFKPTFHISKKASAVKSASPDKYFSDETPRGKMNEFEGGKNDKPKLYYYNVDKNVLGIKFFESEIDENLRMAVLNKKTEKTYSSFVPIL